MSKLLSTMMLAILLAGSATAQDSKAETTDRGDLPMLLISYAYGLSNGMDAQPNALRDDAVLGRIYHSLEASLDQLKVDLPTKLAFIEESFVIQPTVIENRVVGKRGKNTLYVTEPFGEVENTSVAIVSSTKPEATTIFLIDRKLQATLVYDSMAENNFVNGSNCNPLGQINEVDVLHAGVLRLMESDARWSNQHKRVIELDLTSKVPTLKCLQHD